MANNVIVVTHKINELRRILQNLIDRKDDLLDPEIQHVSRLLDEIINEYDVSQKVVK